MWDVVNIDNSKYPQLLKEAGSAPEEIYYKGSWDDSIFNNCLTVVGSRRMTSYGRQITNKLVSEIAAAGITIVSGFMYGIDATAHKAALDVGGKTIAVMPCGIDIIHPEYQESLYREILENNGLIVSEFEGSFPPALWTYPKRNRIVAGLSKATMVIEAGLKSGSLITAGFAKSYKRKLFAVPGPITSISSKGTLQLIKEGACIATSAEDVLEEYNFTRNKKFDNFQKLARLDKLEKLIIERLQQESMKIDVLSRLVKISVSEIGTKLLLMQLKGLLFEEKGKYYLKAG